MGVNYMYNYSRFRLKIILKTKEHFMRNLKKVFNFSNKVLISTFYKTNNYRLN